jgi:hypothetical protein
MHIQDFSPPEGNIVWEAAWSAIFVNMITNADTGILLSFHTAQALLLLDRPAQTAPTRHTAPGASMAAPRDASPGTPIFGMAVTTGTSVNVISEATLPNLVPVLQAQDGSFVGTYVDDSGQTDMVAFDAGYKIRWTVPNEQPQIATADGGVIGQSGTAYDQNGNATGATSPLVQSWTGNMYKIGSVEDIAARAALEATPFYWSFLQAGAAPNSSSPICRDDRDQLIHEYSTYKARFTPFCSDFTPSSNSQPSPHFSFQQLDASDISRNEFPDWAILRTAMLNGLENTLTNYNNQSIAIGSGYRSPKVQSIVNANAPNDRHIYGDAVDMGTGNNQSTWNSLHNAARAAGACVEPEVIPSPKDPSRNIGSTVNHVHADWRFADPPRSPCPPPWLK